MGWYVLYCKSGQEEAIIKSCKQHLSKLAVEDAFLFSYDRMKKYLGKWHVDTYKMFPNYVFLQSSYPELLTEELEQYREITDVLEYNGRLLRVHSDEEMVMNSLCGNSHHLAISRGIVRSGTIRVLEGPLAGREPLIRKLDLHRRIAVLNLKVTEQGQDIWAGITIEPKEL